MIDRSKTWIQSERLVRRRSGQLKPGAASAYVISAVKDFVVYFFSFVTLEYGVGGMVKERCWTCNCSDRSNDTRTWVHGQRKMSQAGSLIWDCRSWSLLIPEFICCHERVCIFVALGLQANLQNYQSIIILMNIIAQSCWYFIGCSWNRVSEIQIGSLGKFSSAWWHPITWHDKVQSTCSTK